MIDIDESVSQNLASFLSEARRLLASGYDAESMVQSAIDKRKIEGAQQELHVDPLVRELGDVPPRCPKCTSGSVEVSRTHWPKDKLTIVNYKCASCGQSHSKGLSEVSMPKGEFEKEHKNLVRVLRHGTKQDREREADDQERELQQEAAFKVQQVASGRDPFEVLKNCL